MTAPNGIDLGIVIGMPSHPQMALDGLWGQAMNTLAGEEPRLRAVVVFVDNGSQQVVPPNPQVTLVPLSLKAGGRAESLAASLSRRHGVAGVAGRLLRDNLHSRRVARTVAAQQETVARLRAADVVVSADTSADRAVWGLRNKSGAALMHGPFAMVAALRALAPTPTLPASCSIDTSQGERE